MLNALYWSCRIFLAQHFLFHFFAGWARLSNPTLTFIGYEIPIMRYIRVFCLHCTLFHTFSWPGLNRFFLPPFFSTIFPHSIYVISFMEHKYCEPIILAIKSFYRCYEKKMHFLSLVLWNKFHNVIVVCKCLPQMFFSRTKKVCIFFSNIYCEL